MFPCFSFVRSTNACKLLQLRMRGITKRRLSSVLGIDGNKNACVWVGQLTGKARENSWENDEQSSTMKTLDVS